MFNKKKFLSIVSLCMLFSVILNIPVFAKSKDEVVKEYNFITSAKQPKYSENKEITIDGKKYVAKEIEYKEVETKKDEVKKEFTNLNEKTIPDEIEHKGKKYVLKSSKFTDNTVTHTEYFKNYVKKPNIPDILDFKIDGKEYTGKKKDEIRTVSSDYNVPFTVPAKFYGSKETMVYDLKGKQVDAKKAPEFTEYRKEVLDYLDLDGNIYRIDTGKWNGDYTIEDGKPIRNAIFTGMQKSDTYTVTYVAESYDAVGTYTLKNNKNEKKEMIAKITYEEKGLTKQEKILIALGIGILALGTVLILYYLSKNKNKDKSVKEKNKE